MIGASVNMFGQSAGEWVWMLLIGVGIVTWALVGHVRDKRARKRMREVDS